MGAIKEKLAKIRKETQGQPASSAASAPSLDSANATQTAGGRSSRFASMVARYAERQTSDSFEDDFVKDSDLDDSSGGALLQSASRSSDQDTATPNPSPELLSDSDRQLLNIIQAWSDPSRPAGSSYDSDLWDKASEDGAHVVFEIIKPAEVALCKIPRDAINGVEALLYDRSLIVSEDVPGAAIYPSHATIIHRDDVLGERGVIRYRVVRSQLAIERAPWLNGSVLRNPAEVLHQESIKSKDHLSRFQGFPARVRNTMK